jgi:uncharacterized membrane protein YhiD involved in acid resistance
VVGAFLGFCIGFFGSGIILRPPKSGILGLTTTSSIWAVTGVGAMVGAGAYLEGVLLTGRLLVVLTWEDSPIVRRFG